MSRALLIISSDTARQKAIEWIRKAPWNTRVTFQGPRRSVDQNALLWAHLTDIASQAEWHGQKMPADDWKDLFMGALKQHRLVPGIEGGFTPIGFRSSDLSKEEFSDLLELIQAFAAKHNITLHEPKALESAA